MKSTLFLSVAAVGAACLCPVRAHSDGAQGLSAPIEPVYFQTIEIGGFWRDHYKRLTEKWLPHCIRQMEAGGEGQELLNLVNTGILLRGEEAGPFTGLPWSDAYVYNTMESICLALTIEPGSDPELAKAQEYLRNKVEEWIPIVLAAQHEDGYIHSYHDLNRLDRYTDTSKHEMYVQGYFIEMGVAHCRMTSGKDRRLYDAAKRCGNQMYENFGPAPKRPWIHGHEGVAYALSRLARLADALEGPGSGDRFAGVAKFLLDIRGREKGTPYNHTHLPVPRQDEAVGHAVRATYLYTGMADMAMLHRDEAYLAAVDKIWASAVHRKMYLTGGVGATGQGEAFAGDFDLPNDSAYCESCAGCGLSFWADRMHRIHQHTHYIDVQERVLYNNVLGALELSGENFFYQNPLAADNARYSWHQCPCCVGNIPRTLFGLKDAMYALNPSKDTLYVNHFVDSVGTIANVAGGTLRIEQKTDYPWQGGVTLVLHPEQSVAFTLKIRIPDRGESDLYTPVADNGQECRIAVNGAPCAFEVIDGYAVLSQTWNAGDRVELVLPMPIQRVYADQRVEANRGCVALQRGPLVYNFEDVDHGRAVESLRLPRDAALETVWRPELLGGVMAIQGLGMIGEEEKLLIAVPNYARLNRGGGSQVWMRE